MSGASVTARDLRNKTRRTLHFEDWPATDQAAWETLFRDGALLDDAGAARHWSAATRNTNQAHYGRWLGWLSGGARRVNDHTPWQRATPEVVEAYARALLAQVAPQTAASSLIGLKCVLQRMAPEADWAWLKRLTNRLDSWATLSRKPRVPEQSVPEMFEIALGELDQLSQLSQLSPPSVRHCQAYRNTLLVALLIACPIRMRNLVQMEVGQHLVRLGDAWHLRFEPDETKTGQALHLVVPADLVPFIGHYLTRIRPAFQGADSHARVWVAQKGRPMAYETIYASVMRTSGRLFGTALNPHAFRSLAATLLAEASPEDALHARPLLGHRQPQTTEKHYIRASQLSAARKVTEALQQIRDAGSTKVE